MQNSKHCQLSSVILSTHNFNKVLSDDFMESFLNFCKFTLYMIKFTLYMIKTQSITN